MNTRGNQIQFGNFFKIRQLQTIPGTIVVNKLEPKRTHSGRVLIALLSFFYLTCFIKLELNFSLGHMLKYV